MLTIDGVSFRYARRREPVLRDVTLAIPSGGIFGLLGPNGAGKTTLISILAEQLRGETGRILINGEPLSRWRSRQPRGVSLVPQEYAFYPMLTVLENLRFFGGVQGIKGASLRQSIERVVAFTQLELVFKRRAGQLSGGLKRRLNLAIGLLTDPLILLLDETTVGVDPQSRAFLLQSIRKLAAPEKIILYTSHYMEEVQAICDRVAVLDHGQVLVSGEMNTLLSDPSGMVTLQLSAPLPETVRAEWNARYQLEVVNDTHYRVRLPGLTGFDQLLAQARSAGCDARTVSYGRRDLEQLFMQLTDRSLRD